jgi:hypothetical protein
VTNILARFKKDIVSFWVCVWGQVQFINVIVDEKKNCQNYGGDGNTEFAAWSVEMMHIAIDCLIRIYYR